ncbi:MAG: hypothetical protein IE909_19240, partial [Campylobacterales bacterium]|nr:hypothetical protein [Campylobacterales bacterium]
LIDVYKNVRSKYEIDFDLFLDTVFEIKAATNTNIDINEKIVFEKEALFNVVLGCNFDYDPFDIFNVQSDLKLTADSKSIVDVEFEEKEFDIARDTFFIPTAGFIARLDFGYTDSDVMHLPIPPIELKTLLVNSANIILDMNFDKAGNDLFHLDFTKEYQAIGGVSYVPVSIFEIDVSNSGIDKTINAKTDFDMVCKINLNI